MLETMTQKPLNVMRMDAGLKLYKTMVFPITQYRSAT